MTVCETSGASEMLMANAVSQLAAKTPGKEAIAIEAYARALRMVCKSLVTEKMLVKVDCSQ